MGRRPPVRQVISILVVAGIAGLLAFRLAQPDPPAAVTRLDGVPLRTWAAAVLDSAAREAGVSFRVRPAIRPLETGTLGRLRETEGYRTFLHRCSSCHDPPDPSMRKPDGWHWVVSRMAAWMERAGVLPMPTADSLAIIQFLEQASGITR